MPDGGDGNFPRIRERVARSISAAMAKRPLQMRRKTESVRMRLVALKPSLDEMMKKLLKINELEIGSRCGQHLGSMWKASGNDVDGI